MLRTAACAQMLAPTHVRHRAAHSPTHPTLDRTLDSALPAAAVDARILRGMHVTLVLGHSATCTPVAARGEHSQQEGAFTREAPAGRIVRTREASILATRKRARVRGFIDSTVCAVAPDPMNHVKIFKGGP